MTAGAGQARHLPTELAGARSPGFWGMVLFIVTEATLFGALLSSYFYILSGTKPWPPDGLAKPELVLPIINTLILVTSSGPMFWADRSAKRGRGRATRVGLAVTFVLGAIFLGIQGFEYSRLGFSPRTDAYGSLFVTITAFHGLHVAGGLLMNLYMQAQAWMGLVGRKPSLALHNVAIYWHFVDIAWIVIFCSLCLVPHLL